MNRESNGDHTGIKWHILVLSKRMSKSPLDWHLLVFLLTALIVRNDVKLIPILIFFQSR